MSDSYFGRQQYVIYCSQLRATPSADCNISHIAAGLSNYLIHIQFIYFSIQFYIQYSTICSIFNFYSVLNASVPLNSSFNIQLFIKCSTFYSTFHDLLNVQLFIQHSMIYSMFNFLFNIQLSIQCSTFF